MASAIPIPWLARRRLMRRSRQIVSVFARYGLSSFLGQNGGSRSRWLPQHEPLAGVSDEYVTRAQHLRLAFAELGGAFIKLGQALSSRPDLIPAPYVTELAKLQDAAPSISYSTVREVVFSELSRYPEDIFSSFDPEPLASASIGQAHAAVLKNGRQVVVKVQRPGVARLIGEDLEILSGMAEWMEAHSALGRYYDITAWVSEFAYRIRTELDYIREGESTEKFRRLFAGDRTVLIPEVFWEWSTNRVLVTERVGGIKVSDLEALDRAGISRRLVAENAVRLLLREVFEFGFFHADPHPGNVFVEPDGAIVLIDFGMVGHLDERTQDTLLRAGLAMMRFDAGRLTDELYNLGVARYRTRRLALQQDLDHALERYAAGSIKEIAAMEVASEVTQICLRHRLQLPSTFITLLRVISIYEGMGVHLEPDFKLMEFATPYVKRFAARRRSPAAMATKFAQTALDAVDLGVDLPRRLSLILTQVERGELAVQTHTEDLAESLQHWHKMANRLALAIIFAGLLVSLALLLTVYQPAAWPSMGGVVFALLLLLALWTGVVLAWGIWRSGRW